MDRTTIGVAGICITLFFFLGFSSLFIYNPIAREESDRLLTIASLNIEGMEGRLLVAYFNFLALGLLNVAFMVGLIKVSKNDAPIIIGKIFILVAGLIWASLGVFGWEYQSGIHTSVLMIRVLSLLIIIPIGLLLLGSEFEKIVDDKFSKYYTLATGVTILSLGVLSLVFIYDDTSIRSNLSLTLYFLWFGVVGLRLIQKSGSQQATNTPPFGP